MSAADGCEVDFFVDFEFRSRLLRRVMSALFAEAVDRMVRAFEVRARPALRHPGGGSDSLGRRLAAVKNSKLQNEPNFA